METATAPTKLTKTIITPGDGKTFPVSGDIVHVYYKGSFTNGEVFEMYIYPISPLISVKVYHLHNRHLYSLLVNIR